MKALLPGVCIAAAVTVASAASAADYSPIDCAKATTPAERTICGNYALGQDEARMATLFGVATSLVAMGQRGDLRDTQREWLKTRDACGGDTGCLANAYAVRIRQLDAVVAGIASRGPF